MADNYVIAISRAFGSGGKTVGKMLAEQLNISYYDRDLIKLASEDSGINEALFGQADESVKRSLFKKRTAMQEHDILPPDSGDFVSNDNLFNIQAKIIRKLAEQETCVIVGRCADYVLRNNKNAVKVFVYASPEVCIQNVIDIYALSKKDAQKKIESIDRGRSAYYTYYTGHEWDNARNYDLCLNSSELGFQKCVDIIKNYIEIRFK